MRRYKVKYHRRRSGVWGFLAFPRLSFWPFLAIGFSLFLCIQFALFLDRLEFGSGLFWAVSESYPNSRQGRSTHASIIYCLGCWCVLTFHAVGLGSPWVWFLTFRTRFAITRTSRIGQRSQFGHYTWTSEGDFHFERNWGCVFLVGASETWSVNIGRFSQFVGGQKTPILTEDVHCPTIRIRQVMPDHVRFLTA